MLKPRFTLRTFSLSIAVIASLFAWWTRTARQQRVAVEIVERSGQVAYWHEQPNRMVKPDFSLEPPGPVWLRNLAGDHFFQRVRSVHTSLTDEEMKKVAHLESIDMLFVDAMQLSGRGISQLRHLSNLRLLHINRGYSLTSEDFDFVSNLRHVEMLRIVGTPIDTSITQHLRELPKLEFLLFESTPIGHAEAKEIQAAMPRLRVRASGRYWGGPTPGEPKRLYVSNVRVDQARASK